MYDEIAEEYHIKYFNSSQYDLKGYQGGERKGGGWVEGG